MGAGASLDRLRNVLVLKAYNARAKDQTIVQQFGPFVQWNDDDNSAYLHVSDIQKCPSLTDEQKNTLAVAPLRWDLVAGTGAAIRVHAVSDVSVWLGVTVLHLSAVGGLVGAAVDALRG